MSKEYSFDIIDDAQNLYVFEARTFADVAKKTGVSIGQIKRWSAKYDWQKLKDFFLKARSQKRIRILQLSVDALKGACDARIPQEKAQLIHAWKGVEDVLLRMYPAKKTEAAVVDEPALFLKNLEFVARILNESDPEGLKILAKNFDMLTETFKKQYAQTS